MVNMITSQEQCTATWSFPCGGNHFYTLFFLRDVDVPQISICFFCSLSSFDTGMPISTFKLIRHFNDQPKYKVRVVLPAEGELSQRVRECGIEPRVIPFYRLRSVRRTGEFVRFLFSFPGTFLRLYFFLRKNRISLIHFSDIIDMPFFACGLLARAKTVAHLRHCIESVPARFLFGLLAALFVDNVVCISQAVLRFSGLSRRRAHVIYNPGPDVSLFDPEKSFPEVSGLPERKRFVLTIGKFLRVKGHEHFVRMARRVESMRPGLCRFVILGNKLPAHERYYAKIRGLIEESGLSDSITILDPVSHETIPAVLARSSVYVHLPNWQEGLGGTVLEAMAMQVPVVAFDCGGVGECFTGNVSGFLVPRFDIEEASDRVVQLLCDERLRKQMGAAARNELVSKFSYEKHFSEIERMYHDLFCPPDKASAPFSSC
jgi:glycosyltransferase involved in cell wall biosynthesis